MLPCGPATAFVMIKGKAGQVVTKAVGGVAGKQARILLCMLVWQDALCSSDSVLVYLADKGCVLRRETGNKQ